MTQQVPELDQRLAELQTQIDQLTLSLHLWRETQDRLQPTEERLSELTERAAGILDQWTSSGARHARAIGELEVRLHDLNTLESRVERDATERIRDLERGIEHEWKALRDLHEEPARRLTEQASTLTEVAVTTAANAQRGFDRAEARLSTIEHELNQRMTELTRELRAVAVELRTRPGQQLAAPAAASWPLEGVMRLHQELRQSPDDESPPAPLLLPAQAESPAQPESLSERIATLEHVIAEGQTTAREAGARAWRFALAVLIAGVLISAAVVWQMQDQVRMSADRADAAQRQAQIATDSASRELASVRESAARQMAEARDAALKTRIVSDVVAAPDLVRYNLFGGNASGRYSAQLLWSRSRGVVLSGASLPPPDTGSTYQLWLSTPGGPVSAGSFTPDSSGRITFATEPPAAATRPVISAFVTVEPTGGREAPTGATLLARVQSVPPPVPPLPDEPAR